MRTNKPYVYTNSAASRHHNRAPRRRSMLKPLALLVAIAVVVGSLAYGISYATKSSLSVSEKKSTAQTSGSSSATAPAGIKLATACASNSLSQLVLVSISKQHLWACNGSAVAYDSAVVTGMENLPADLTPTGTYHIYAKEIDLYLNGSDSTGSWHDYVYYWMPFLDNQYGAYGIHDATWRPASAFGNINIYTDNASHGCVETPLVTAKWIYNWVSVGTTVTIVS